MGMPDMIRVGEEMVQTNAFQCKLITYELADAGVLRVVDPGMCTAEWGLECVAEDVVVGSEGIEIHDYNKVLDDVWSAVLCWQGRWRVIDVQVHGESGVEVLPDAVRDLLREVEPTTI